MLKILAKSNRIVKKAISTSQSHFLAGGRVYRFRKPLKDWDNLVNILVLNFLYRLRLRQNTIFLKKIHVHIDFF